MLGIASACLFGLLAVFSVIYYQAAAWICIAGLSLSLGVALWQQLTRKAYLNKNQRIFCSLGLAIVILVVGWMIMARIPLTDPIAVSPPEVKLTDLFSPDKRFRGKIPLLVYNRSDDPYHQIWVKIIIQSDFLSPDLIDLDFSQNTGLGPLGCIKGTDKNSKKAFLCFIGSLGPKKEFNIKLTSNFDAGHISDEQLGKAFIVVSKFETYPHQSYENPPGGERSAGWNAVFPDTEVGFKSQ